VTDTRPGRPPIGNEPMRQVSMYLPAEQIEWLKQQPGGMGETVRTYVEEKMNEQRMTIKVTEQLNGEWILTDEAGTPVQEAYSYSTRKDALEAAQQLWPSNSVWQGRPVKGGWSIIKDE
jgi:hypothetical protein